MARLKGTLVHLLTYDHDNDDDEKDYVEDNEDEDKDDKDEMRMRILMHKKGSKELGPLTRLQHA